MMAQMMNEPVNGTSSGLISKLHSGGVKKYCTAMTDRTTATTPGPMPIHAAPTTAA
jgi:hypothetical protein